MILPSPTDALHKAWLYRVLTQFADHPLLAKHLAFKGGTCAALLGYLDRFSVDLDFDFVGKDSQLSDIRVAMESIFMDMGLEIKDTSLVVPQYFLKYPTKNGVRNTLKIDTTITTYTTTLYKEARFHDIDRTFVCQTIESMFAHKLVALYDRFQKGHTIAGRDLYDIHHYFLHGYTYIPTIIKERTGQHPKDFLLMISVFIKEHVTQQIIDQDLNSLIPPTQFRQLRLHLIHETLMFLKSHIETL